MKLNLSRPPFIINKNGEALREVESANSGCDYFSICLCFANRITNPRTYVCTMLTHKQQTDIKAITNSSVALNSTMTRLQSQHLRET